MAAPRLPNEKKHSNILEQKQKPTEPSSHSYHATHLKFLNISASLADKGKIFSPYLHLFPDYD